MFEENHRKHRWRKRISQQKTNSFQSIIHTLEQETLRIVIVNSVIKATHSIEGGNFPRQKLKKKKRNFKGNFPPDNPISSRLMCFRIQRIFII